MTPEVFMVFFTNAFIAIHSEGPLPMTFEQCNKHASLVAELVAPVPPIRYVPADTGYIRCVEHTPAYPLPMVR